MSILFAFFACAATGRRPAMAERGASRVLDASRRRMPCVGQFTDFDRIGGLP